MCWKTYHQSNLESPCSLLLPTLREALKWPRLVLTSLGCWGMALNSDPFVSASLLLGLTVCTPMASLFSTTECCWHYFWRAGNGSCFWNAQMPIKRAYSHQTLDTLGKIFPLMTQYLLNFREHQKQYYDYSSWSGISNYENVTCVNSSFFSKKQL